MTSSWTTCVFLAPVIYNASLYMWVCMSLMLFLKVSEHYNTGLFLILDTNTNKTTHENLTKGNNHKNIRLLTFLHDIKLLRKCYAE